MLTYQLRPIAAVALLLLLCTFAQAQQRDGSLTARDRIADPRLERKITLTSDRILLGTLLEKLSSQGGVSLRINERDTLSRIPVLVSIRDVPLGEAMNALWSLLCYHAATWRWEIEGREGSYTYTLVPSFAAHQLSSRIKEESQAVFEAHAEAMMRVARMAPEERKHHVKEISASLLQPDEGMAGAWIESDNLWEGLRTFAESASPETLSQVLRGKTVLTIPVSGLSEAGRAFVKHYMARGSSQQVNADGSLSPSPEPREIHFAALGVDAADEDVTPSLVVSLQRGGMSFMGGYGLSIGFQDRIEKQWLLPGDSSVGAVENTLVAEPKQGTAATDDGDGSRQPIASRGVLQLAKAAPLSVMGLLPDIQGADPGPPYRMTVKEYVAKLRGYARLMRKWRHGVLLVSSLWRLTDNDVSMPYRLIKRLTKTGVQGKNFLSLAEMSELLTELSKNQIVKAARQFAVVQSAAQFAPLLAVYRVDRDLGRTGGMACTPELAGVVRQVANLSPNHPILNGQALRLRLTVQDDTLGNTPIRRTQVEYLNADRKWSAVMGLRFIQMGMAPPEGPK